MPKEKVTCSQCGNPDLLRWPINRVTKLPIKNFFCNNQCKGAWQIKQREDLGFNKEWLEDQYLKQGKSANMIAREIGRDGKRVWEWLESYGIPIRPRGHNYAQNLHRNGSAFRGRKHSEQTRNKLSEIAKSDGRVPWGKGNEPYWKGKTGSQHPGWKGGLTPERQAFYSTVEWSDAVKAVWKRDNATCQRCGKHHNQASVRGTFHIHHIVSFMVRELRADPSNLVLLCNKCHRWVHGKENTEKLFIKEMGKDTQSHNG